MSDLEFKAKVKSILRKLAKTLEEHIEYGPVNVPDALKQIREAQESIEEI